MARIARVVVPGFPHHIVQRGNRRLNTFFNHGDFEYYKQLLSVWCKAQAVEVWCYCLMSNHLHLILVPQTEDGLRIVLSEVHRRYTRRINFREGWRGHLWQARYLSYIMDEQHLLAASRYIELNPVKAGMVKDPFEYAWSSAKAHLNNNDDSVVTVKPMLDRIHDWKQFIYSGINEPDSDIIDKHLRTGRPLGSKDFVEQLEILTGRDLSPRRSGRPKKNV